MISIIIYKRYRGLNVIESLGRLIFNTGREDVKWAGYNGRLFAPLLKFPIYHNGNISKL